jgi:hypothetical protein
VGAAVATGAGDGAGRTGASDGAGVRTLRAVATVVATGAVLVTGAVRRKTGRSRLRLVLRRSATGVAGTLATGRRRRTTGACVDPLRAGAPAGAGRSLARWAGERPSSAISAQIEPPATAATKTIAAARRRRRARPRRRSDESRSAPPSATGTRAERRCADRDCSDPSRSV